MNYTGNENHDINLTTAAEWTKNFRDSVPAGSIIAHYYGKSAIEDIFAQTACMGMRLYYALDADAVKQIIVTGVDASGNDLYTDLLAENSLGCPVNCSSPNPLNTDQ